MGLFSFLFGGKQARRKPVVKPAPAAPPPAAAAGPIARVADAPVAAAPGLAPGVRQAQLRLKLAASLRTGKHGVAYDAARALADIQVRAGRKTVARVWQQQADRIKASMTA